MFHSTGVDNPTPILIRRSRIVHMNFFLEATTTQMKRAKNNVYDTIWNEETTLKRGDKIRKNVLGGSPYQEYIPIKMRRIITAVPKSGSIRTKPAVIPESKNEYMESFSV